MIEDRFVLSDGVWDLIAPLLPGKRGDRGATASDNRRFRRWARAGIFESLFSALSGEPDFEYALIDGTIVSVHQKATGAKGGLSLRPSGGREVD